MKTSVSYARISTKSKDGKQSVESQEPVIVKYCQENNLTLIKQFTEEISGDKKYTERPVLEELLKFVIDNKIKNLVVVELSRLGRNLSDIIEIADILKENKICLHLISEDFKTIDNNGEPSLMGEMMIIFGGFFARMERQKIKERSIRGLKFSAQYLGRWSGGQLLPYGYARSTDEDTKKQLVINKKEANVVRRIFELYKQGYGTTKIADYLNERKIPTRYNLNLKNPVKRKNSDKKQLPSSYSWRDATVYNILTNPIYKGIRKFKDLELISPKIIEPDFFDEVKSLLKERYNKKNSIVHFYLLEHVKLICGLCGQSYFAHRRKDGSDDRYICLSKRYKGSRCENYGIGIDKLAFACWYVIRRTDQLIRHINKTIEESSMISEIKKLEENLENLNKQIRVEQNEQKNLYRLKKIGKINEDLYLEEFDITTAKILEYNAEKEYCVNSIKEKYKYIENKRDINSVIREVKDDLHMMKEYFSEIVKSITIYPVKNALEISNVNNDKSVLCKLQLKLSPKPLFFCITRYSWNILILPEEWINFDSLTVNTQTDNRYRISEIQFKRKTTNPDEINKNAQEHVEFI